MYRKKILLAVVLVLALSLLASGVIAGDLKRATGSGHYYLSDGTYWTQTFSAIEHADGRVSGQVNAVAHGDPTRIGHIAVDCLNVIENTPYGDIAIMSGWLTNAVNPSPNVPIPGYATFLAADGGEGPEAVDIISSAHVESNPGINCQNVPLGLLLPLRVTFHGNIQVSP